MSTQRIYLDNAATSFPKPAAVYDAVDRYQRELGVAVGRGAYRRAMAVQDVASRCRLRVAELFRAESPERIIFTFNGTDSLNLALHGLLRSGDHVVTSTIEHNSVLRPLRFLRDQLGVEVDYVSADSQGRIDPARVKAALRANTKLVAIVHASNVTGTVQPIEDIGELARKAGAIVLVDAAQTAGHVPIDVSQLPLDLLACPGHKGLLGPLGTGILYVRPGVEERLASLRQGGTGSRSEDDRQPDALPDKYEAGNHNAAGLFGLEAALSYLKEQGVEGIREHERQLIGRLLDGLSGCQGLVSYGTQDAEGRVGVSSLNIEGFDPQVLAALLDENFGIECRAGLHCAPGAHKCLGTFESGGTVRLSAGPFTTAEEIDQAVQALRALGGATK
jgi:cysteine desulfurase family protein